MQAGGEVQAAGRVSVWTGVGVAIAMLGPLFLASEPMQQVYALAGSAYAGIFVGQAFLWGVLALALACLVYGDRLPLAAVSIVPPRAKSVAAGLAIGFGVYAVLFAILVVLSKLELFDAKSASESVVQWPLWLKLFAAITAGVVEEALYRGYAIERLTALTGRRWLAAILALLAFALAHVPFWGLAALATPILGGGFFTLIYLWRRDLVACMVAHCAVDLIGLIVAPLLNALGA